ncbi:MAG: aminodeoxychorismate/anthranilate synthase component II [Actinobacteria bacterium]|nr:aminodeoxychorismate/anthranilate synthase component II [Actinomycetota bacterium]
MIDNFDSFTYNLVWYLQVLGDDVAVFRNNVKIEDIASLWFDRIVISPGPGRPENSGVSIDVINTFAEKLPILGVCLGHQCIVEVYGGKIIRDRKPVHGKVSKIFHDNKGILRGVQNPFLATRYHSLIAESTSLPSCLEITAHTEDGIIMGIQHKNLKIFGLQFHPESFLTEDGFRIMKNFLEMK